MIQLVQKEEETGKQLRTSIDALRHDPKAVERLARESFGYAKTGEIVIRFEQPQTNNARGDKRRSRWTGPVTASPPPPATPS